MAFTMQDFSDLTRLLVEHPEWRSELRRLLLSDELLTLPQAVRELIEAQQHAEERLARLETTVQHLIEAQQHAEERLSRLETTVQALTEQVRTLIEAQQHTEERLQRLETAIEKLVEAQHRTTDTVGKLKGLVLELTYYNKAWAYFGHLLRRLRVVEPHTLEDTLEAKLTPGEFRDLLHMDVLLTGFPRLRPAVSEVWLAVEISSVVDQSDVDRAERRAKLLRQAGYCALPVAAGEQMTRGAEESARIQKVALLQDGQPLFWQEALDAWVT